MAISRLFCAILFLLLVLCLGVIDLGLYTHGYRHRHDQKVEILTTLYLPLIGANVKRTPRAVLTKVLCKGALSGHTQTYETTNRCAPFDRG